MVSYMDPIFVDVIRLSTPLCSIAARGIVLIAMTIILSAVYNIAARAIDNLFKKH